VDHTVTVSKATSTAALEDGSILYGTTFYPHYLPHQAVELPGMQLLSVLSVKQDFDGKGLWVRTESEVLALAPGMADAALATVTSTGSSVS
jgi:hypothetical protein